MRNRNTFLTCACVLIFMVVAGSFAGTGVKAQAHDSGDSQAAPTAAKADPLFTQPLSTNGEISQSVLPGSQQASDLPQSPLTRLSRSMLLNSTGIWSRDEDR